jgi:hydroxylamine dehydrogenase
MKSCLIFLIPLFLLPGAVSGADDRPLSDESASCLECHASLHPGIVAGWQKSRMSKITPTAAKALPERKRRVSYEQLPEALAGVVVGCAECHTLNAESHKDSFDHNGYEVHTVVTPQDCSTCHPVEARQFEKNIMSHAYGNLENNPVYRELTKAVTGMQTFEDMATTLVDPDELTLSDACRQCHGTFVKVEGTVSKDTPYGDMEFPVLSGWPNQGVGRINPDGSKGFLLGLPHPAPIFHRDGQKAPHLFPVSQRAGCSRLQSLRGEQARQCLLLSGPRVELRCRPLVIGKDLTAPTCATCHVSLVVNDDGDVVAERTHQMNDRLAWRIFGLPYAHPHPSSPDTTIIRNHAGLPLPTELTGEPVWNSSSIRKSRKLGGEGWSRFASPATAAPGWKAISLAMRIPSKKPMT